MIGAKMIKPNRNMRWMVIGMCLAVGGAPFMFADPPVDPGKPLRYLMVLKAQGAGAEEPDVRQAGGRELSRWRTRRLIEIPRPAIEALSRHKAVSYLALVDDGMETDAPRYVLGQAEGSSLRVETNVEPELGWDSGLYQYDDSGNITAIGANTFQYDKAQRLKKAVVGGETIEYTYDSFGNQNERKIGTTIVKTTASADSNQLNDAQYDRAGNQTSAIGSAEDYVYDAANMMVQRAMRRYIYTADDERIGTANDVGETEWEWTIRDFSGRVIATYESYCGASELCTWEWKEVHHHREGALSSGVTIDERVRGIGNARYFHLDHLGTTRLITNQARQKIAAHDFHPFGREQTKVNQEFTGWMNRSLEPMKFAGHERDYTSSIDANVHDYLDYMHARFYNPSQGRFLSVDPGKDWDPRQPQSWNMYAYVRNNPINTIDPTGKWGWSDFKSWIRDTRADISNWWSEKWHKDIPAPADQYGGVEALEAADLLPADAQQMGNPQANWANARAEAGAILSDQATEEVMTFGVGKVVGVAGVVVFGHGARHLIGTALQKEAVEAAIEKEVQFVSREASQTGSFWGRVKVNGQVIEYRAHTLPDGTINVGTYYTPKP